MEVYYAQLLTSKWCCGDSCQDGKGNHENFQESHGEQQVVLERVEHNDDGGVNVRPIGLKPNTSTDPEYLSPNSLYLGRCSDRVNAGPFQPKEYFSDDPKQVRSRFQLVQVITSQFWKVWQKIFFPTLLIRQKWHYEKRSLKVGDICLLQDANAFRGEWRLVKVVATFPDRRGCVRNVEVMAVPTQDGSLPYKPVKANFLKRHVSNLIVIVPVEDEDQAQVDKEQPDISLDLAGDRLKQSSDEKTIKERYFEENSEQTVRSNL